LPPGFANIVVRLSPNISCALILQSSIFLWKISSRKMQLLPDLYQRKSLVPGTIEIFSESEELYEYSTHSVEQIFVLSVL